MKKKRITKKQKTLIWIALGLVVLVLAGLLICNGWKNKQSNKVMTIGDTVIDNTMFSYFFWTEVNYRYAEGSDQPGPDMQLTLDVQMYDDTTTWEEYLIAEIVPMVEYEMAMVKAAEAEGFTMPEEIRQQCDSVLENFRQNSEDMKYGSLNDYLVDTYGKGANEKSFKQYLYYDFLAVSYNDALFSKTEPTEEQVQEYYETWRSNYEEGDYEAAAADLHKEEYYNAVAAVQAEYPVDVQEENIVIEKPHGAHLQTGEEH